MIIMAYVVRCFDATGGLRRERNLCGKIENKQVPRRRDERKGQQMNADTQRPIDRIRKVSRVVRTLCTIGMGLTLVASLVGGAMLITGSSFLNECGTIELSDAEGPVKVPIGQLTVTSRVLVTVVFVLAMAITMKGMFHLRKLFGHYASGNVFTVESVAQIRQLGITFLLVAGLQLLDGPIAFALALLCGKTPTVSVTLDIVPFPSADGGVIGSAAAAGLLILISWVMDIGRGLREEIELTI